MSGLFLRGFPNFRKAKENRNTTDLTPFTRFAVITCVCKVKWQLRFVKGSWMALKQRGASGQEKEACLAMRQALSNINMTA